MQENKDVLAELRTALLPYWSPVETGGIILLADVGDDRKHFEIFSRFFSYFPSINTQNENLKWQNLADAIAKICFAFIHDKTWTLEPGVYELDNYHLSYAENGYLYFDSNRHPPTQISNTSKFSFHLRKEHMKLLRFMTTRSSNDYVLLMDVKRPYGDAVYYYYDIANALGEPAPLDAEGYARFPPETIERYMNLHREMLFATQAFWRYAHRA